MPLVLRVAVGVLPIFIGCAFFAMSTFGGSFNFSGFSRSFYTLFALMQGDSIFDTYREITPHNFLIGTIFMFMEMFFAISFVQNIFLILVGDGYLTVKYRKKSDWLNKESNDPALENFNHDEV
jgi:hypothetical protein